MAQKDYWKCKCDCGNDKAVIVQGANLTSGYVTSCGCAKQMSQFMDLTGQVYGDLTVLEFVGRKNLHSYWQCKCSCGNEVVVTGNNLRRGHTTTCGHKTNTSKEELSIRDAILNLNPDLNIVKSRRILDGKEIDIYLPDYKLGIEYNGSFYHSTPSSCGFKSLPKNFHQQKFITAKEHGIRLINLFDVDWMCNKDKILSILCGYLGLNTKVYGRECELVEVDYRTAKDFCNKYHLQNYSRYAKINIGLTYQGSLVSLMCFGNYRLKKAKNNQYELHRFVSKDGLSVIGGASKMFNYFVTTYKANYVLSYSDNDYFSGNVYDKLGFKCLGQVAPSYYWFKAPNIVMKREQCQVHKLKSLYPELYDENASNKENDIMLKLKYCKVYRSGNTKWGWINYDY